MEKSRGLHAEHITNIFEYQDEDFWIQTSSIEATFGDGSKMELDTISVNATTPMGMEILLTSDDVEHPEKRSIRLILIRPEHDWRQTANYAWKLDNAWMADQLSSSAPTYSWLHWNVESYIDSRIQVPHFNNVWQCDELEFHFTPIGKGSSSGHFSSSQLTPMVTLTNVKIGAMMSSSPGEFEIYIPPECKGQEECKFVDGTTESSGIIQDLLEERDGQLLLGGIFGLIALGLLIICTGKCCGRRNRRSEEYEPIEGVEMSGTDEIINKYHDEEDESELE